MKINAEVVKEAFDSYFTPEEIAIIEKIIDSNIYNLVNHKLLIFGIVAIDVCVLDDYMDPPLGVSLWSYITNKFGEDAEEVMRKAIHMRCVL